MEIGERLKEAREEKGISLDDLQDSTKIQKRYLIAIEEGNFDVLPGKFYARAFIREYALAVGLDHNELLEEYSNEMPEVDVQEPEELSRMQRTRSASEASKNSSIFSMIPTIIVGLLIVGIIFVAVILYQKSTTDPSSEGEGNQSKNEIIRSPSEDKDNEDNEILDEVVNETEDTNENNNQDVTNNDENEESNQEDESNEENEDNENDAKNEATDEGDLTVSETIEGQRPESIFEFTSEDDSVVLTLQPSGESWLDITNENGETLYSGMTQDGEDIEVDITDHDKIRLNIGYAPSLLDIKVNDIELEYAVDPDQYVNQLIWIETNEMDE